MAWYTFVPGTPPDPSDPNQYTNIGSTPPSCPFNVKVCAIQAMDDGGLPIITTSILRELVRALQNGTESTNVLLKNS